MLRFVIGIVFGIILGWVWLTYQFTDGMVVCNETGCIRFVTGEQL